MCSRSPLVVVRFCQLAPDLFIYLGRRNLDGSVASIRLASLHMCIGLFVDY